MGVCWLDLNLAKLPVSLVGAVLLTALFSTLAMLLLELDALVLFGVEARLCGT